MSKSRVFYLDVMRIVACLYVIARHAWPPDYDFSGNLQKLYIYAFEPGPALFFMISGACLLGKELEFSSFIKTRLSRLVPLIAVWTIINLGLMYFLDGMLIHSIKFYVLSFFFTNLNGGLWFLYCILGLYILTPILNVWLKSATKRQIELYILLWVITAIIPVLGKFIMIELSQFGMWYYFCGFIGFYLLGYYIHVYMNFTKNTIWQVVLMAVVALMTVYLNLYNGWDITGLYDAEIANVCYATIVFIFVKFIFTRNCVDRIFSKSLITFIANLTLGVYLFHGVVNTFMAEYFPYGDMSSVVAVLLTFFVSTVASFLVVWLLSYLPFSRFIVGNYISLKKNK